MQAIDPAAVARIFEMPECAVPFISAFYTPAEQRFALDCSRGEFSEASVPSARAMHARGVVDAVEGKPGVYRVGTFYTRLDVFAVSEYERWMSIPQPARRAMEAWYLDAYVAWLDGSCDAIPTRDTVLTLDETLAFIDADDRQMYVNVCDCRNLFGGCGKPVEVCLTYKDAPNTFRGRGLSRPVSKEEAKEIVRKADAAALMHTANPNGICNCCGDCCYLMRGMKTRGSWGVWPIQPHEVRFDSGECIGCSRCVRRCNMGVFERVPGVPGKGRGKFKVEADTSMCVGCGLCVETCPTNALSLRRRALPVDVAAASVVPRDVEKTAECGGHLLEKERAL